MSVDKRISEEGFRVQNRYSMIAASIALLLLTGLFHLGVYQVRTYISQEEEQQIVQTQVLSPKATTPTDETITPAKPQPDIIDTVPIREVQQVSPRPSQAKSPDWYAQVHAISRMADARVALRQQAAPASRQVHLAYIATDPQPYKILIGPFSDRQSTQQYITKHALAAWPRQVPSQLLVT